jgi:hypothetical protein
MEFDLSDAEVKSILQAFKIAVTYRKGAFESNSITSSEADSLPSYESSFQRRVIDGIEAEAQERAKEFGLKVPKVP